MSIIKLTKSMRDYLLEHIAEIEKVKDSVLKKHYSEDVIEGNNFESFINSYISSITNIIDESKISARAKNSCPFVIIGSIVAVHDIDEDETYNYLITAPYSTYDKVDADNASCLSPLGQALLFKEVDEKIEVNVPAGTLNYVIKDIVVPKFSENQDPALSISDNSSVGNFSF